MAATKSARQNRIAELNETGESCPSCLENSLHRVADVSASDTRVFAQCVAEDCRTLHMDGEPIDSIPAVIGRLNRQGRTVTVKVTPAGKLLGYGYLHGVHRPK